MSTLSRIQEVLGQISDSEYLSLRKIEDGNFKGHVVTLNPANLKAIDIDAWVPGSSDPVIPPMGAGRWVEPVYTDEWVFSDGQEHSITLAEYSDSEYIFNLDGQDLEWEHNGEMWMMGMPETISKDEIPTYTEFSIVDPDDTDNNFTIKAYRKYTPGHWEDDAGNWINGSWIGNEWNPIDWNRIHDELGCNPIWVSDHWEMDNPPMPLYPSEIPGNKYDAVVSTEWNGSDLIQAWCRTWNNTKAAPAA